MLAPLDRLPVTGCRLPVAGCPITDNRQPITGNWQLKHQSALSRAIGEGLHAPMILVAAAVEYHGRDALLLTAFRDQLAYRFGGVDVAARFQLLTQLGVHGGGCGEGVTGSVVDQLRIDMLQTARYVQTRPLRRAAHLGAHPAV